MIEHFEATLGLLCAVAALGALGKRVPVPLPILQVLGGAALSSVPVFAALHLDPEVFFALFIPALLFADGWRIPKRDVLKVLRPVLLLALGLVALTVVVVGYLIHALIPAIPLAAAFALGAVVSPTDAVAASAVTEKVDLPGRVSHIVNGESLLNDASGLVAFKFAVAAVATGTFSAQAAALSFVVLSGGGIVAGLLVAWLIGELRVWLVCGEISEPAIQTTLSLLTPYAAYFAAERVGVSGILAAVAAGMYAGIHDTRHLTTEDRLQTDEVWTVLLFGLNGLAFVFLGLRLPEIAGNIAAGVGTGNGAPGWGTLAGYAAVLSLVVMALRVAWVYPGAYLPRLLFKCIREQETAPRPGAVFVVGWAGLRGSVNLAAALSLPLATAGGTPFPGRDLILFLAASVIVATLLVNGLTLPWLARRLDLGNDGSAEAEERLARVAAARAAVDRIRQYVIPESSPHEQAFATDLIAGYERRLRHLSDDGVPPSPDAPEAAADEGTTERQDLEVQLKVERNLRLTALQAEGEALLVLHRDRTINEETVRRIQREIDHLQSALAGPGP